MCTKAKSCAYPRAKFLLDNYPNAVYSSLLGTTVTNRNLVVLNNYNIIMRRDYRTMSGKVKIIGGGGAGIEPAEVNYIGKGMLTAAVLGDMYSAPSAEEILIAIRELAEGCKEGILLLVKNYTGDKLNFGLAMDRANNEGILVQMLLLGDDASELTLEKQGRRGLAGCALIYKIAGEMAEQEKSIEEIIEECRDNLLTDLATASLTLPTCGRTFCESLGPFLDPDEMALGMGVYGQHGKKKTKFCDMSNAVAVALQEFYYFSKPGFDLGQTNVIVLLSNHGSLSKFEESIIALEVSKQLNQLGVNIIVMYSGTFMSPTNTHGFSISLLKVNNPMTLKYLESPTMAPGWPKPILVDSVITKETGPPAVPNIVQPTCPHKKLNEARMKAIPSGPEISPKAVAATKQIIIFAAEALISCEKQLNIIDSEVGDGDTGTNMRKGAEKLKAAIFNNELNLSHPAKFLNEISVICCKFMGGVSGALYTVFFGSAAAILQEVEEITPEVCCAAFKAAVKAIKHYGRTELGDRTVLDALCPAVDTFETAVSNGKDMIEALYLAAATCEYKSEQTKMLKPPWQQDMKINRPLLYADPGAHAVTIWLRAISEGFRLTYPNISFENDRPTEKPGIFLWRFLTEEDCDTLLAEDSNPTFSMSYIEQKLGGNETLLGILLNETYKHCREQFEANKKKISALVGTVYYAHKYYSASQWRNASEVYYFFRESILRQSVEYPPVSAEIFLPPEARNALIFFFEMYIRNLPLVRIMHLPHYKLRLKIGEESVEVPRDIKDADTVNSTSRR